MNHRVGNLGDVPALAGFIRGCVALMLAVAGSSCPVLAVEAEQTQTYSSFTEWCLNKDRVSTEARHTIEVLLPEAKTSDCNEVNQILFNLTELQLHSSPIRNLQPLSSLANLTRFTLDGNPIQTEDRQPPDQNAELRLLRMKGYCRDCNLAGLDFRGADLVGVYLQNANLTRADFSDADLFYANLVEANLTGANFEGADLEGVLLFKANLSNANLRKANLTDANLSQANLSGANLTDAKLCGATMPDESISKQGCL